VSIFDAHRGESERRFLSYAYRGVAGSYSVDWDGLACDGGTIAWRLGAWVLLVQCEGPFWSDN
jgi:hypothetical protein